MANTTFSGPVRSENGFLEKDEAGDWVPVSGGGGGALAIPLVLNSGQPPAFTATPALVDDSYDGTVAATVDLIDRVTPGTYSNISVLQKNDQNVITNIVSGTLPAATAAVQYITNSGSVTVNGFETITVGTLPSGSMLLDMTIMFSCNNSDLNTGEYFYYFVNIGGTTLSSTSTMGLGVQDAAAYSPFNDTVTFDVSSTAIPYNNLSGVITLEPDPGWYVANASSIQWVATVKYIPDPA